MGSEDARCGKGGDFVDRSIEKEQRRLEAEQDAALADQKRIADAAKASARNRLMALLAIGVAAVVAGVFGPAQVGGPSPVKVLLCDGGGLVWLEAADPSATLPLLFRIDRHRRRPAFAYHINSS